MKFTQPTTAKRILALGLLATTLPPVIKDFLPVPDFVRGFMLGIGLALEVIGIVLMKKKSTYLNSNSQN